MNAKEFVAALAAGNERALSALRSTAPLRPLCEQKTIAAMLKMALKNELEATELAALWIHSTPELDVKLGFARQVADESRHYRLIEERLAALGEDLAGFSPLAGGYSPLFQYLSTLRHTVERIAAGQFTREAIALVKNLQFIDLAQATGDEKTVRLYVDIIQPDETFHHRMGRALLEQYAVTDELQALAGAAAARTLELAEELQELALKTRGMHHAPGC